jgi:hypothetical protein
MGLTLSELVSYEGDSIKRNFVSKEDQIMRTELMTVGQYGLFSTPYKWTKTYVSGIPARFANPLLGVCLIYASTVKQNNIGLEQTFHLVKLVKPLDSTPIVEMGNDSYIAPATITLTTGEPYEFVTPVSMIIQKFDLNTDDVNQSVLTLCTPEGLTTCTLSEFKESMRPSDPKNTSNAVFVNARDIFITTNWDFVRKYNLFAVDLTIEEITERTALRGNTFACMPTVYPSCPAISSDINK